MTKIVIVGRLTDHKSVSVDDNATIEDAFEQAGYDLQDDESIRDINKEEIKKDAVVKTGMSYFAVFKNKNQ